MKILGLGDVLDGWTLVSIKASGVVFHKTEQGQSRTKEMGLECCEVWLKELGKL